MSNNMVNNLIIQTSPDFTVKDIDFNYIFSLTKKHGRISSYTDCVYPINSKTPTFHINMDETGFNIHINNKGNFLVICFDGTSAPQPEILEIAEILSKLVYFYNSKLPKEEKEKIWAGLNENNIKYVDNETSIKKARKKLEKILKYASEGKIDEIKLQDNGMILLTIPHEKTPSEALYIEDLHYSKPMKSDEPIYNKWITLTGKNTSIINSEGEFEE